ATAELTIAHDLKPGDFETTAQLVKLLIRQGTTDRAAALVDDVAGTRDLPIDRRLWAADVYCELGRSDAAISLLTKDGKTGEDGVPEGFLAQVFRRAGKKADAQSLYERVLQDPAATADALVAGAEFFA